MDIRPRMCIGLLLWTRCWAGCQGPGNKRTECVPLRNSQSAKMGAHQGAKAPRLGLPTLNPLTWPLCQCRPAPTCLLHLVPLSQCLFRLPSPAAPQGFIHTSFTKGIAPLCNSLDLILHIKCDAHLPTPLVTWAYQRLQAGWNIPLKTPH